MEKKISNRHFSDFKVLEIFLITGIVFFLTFSTVYLINRDFLGWVVELLIALGLLGDWFYLKKSGNLRRASNVALFLLIPFYGFLLTTGGIGKTGLFWLHPFPAVAFYFKGSKRGLVWSAVLGFVLVLLFLIDVTGLYGLPYTAVDIRQALASYVLLVIFIYIYQVSNERKEILISEAGGELEEHRDKLESAVVGGRELEAKYKEEKDRVNLIVNSMGEGLLVVEKDFKVSMINSSAENFLGVKEKDIIGKPWHEIAKAFEGTREISLEERVSTKVLNSGITIATLLEDDHYYVTKSGKKFPVVSVTTPILQGARVVGAVKVFRDATEEKEAKILINEAMKSKSRELETEQVRSHAILENAGEGVILTNSRGEITYVNPTFEKLTGYSEKDLKGKDFSETVKVYDLKDKQIPASQVSDAAAVTAKKQEMKVCLEKKNGDKITLLVNASPVNATGRFIGIVRIFHDITEEMQLQQQKDDFFSIASHELRTPLSVIGGNLDTVLSGYGKSQITDEDMQLLQDSIEATDRLIKMVSDFLNVSRLDQGRLKYDIRPLDACFITEAVIRELIPLAEKKGIKIVKECASDEKHKMVMADETLLKEVLINLIGNSIKFTTKGEIRIEHEIKDGMSYTKVLDTGLGIAKDKQKLLFQRFQQAMDRTLARQAGGTGLGLYISREFARVMGGDLILEKSGLGKGSTFSVTLPLSENNQ